MTGGHPAAARGTAGNREVLDGTAAAPIMKRMANLGMIIRTAGSVLAASAAILATIKENPQLAEGATKALDKVKSATNSQNPKLRFEAKLAAIDACADAVETNFGNVEEAGNWRREAAALRVRGDLTWNAHQGKERRAAMRGLNEETAQVLARINERLTQLTDSLPRELPDD